MSTAIDYQQRSFLLRSVEDFHALSEGNDAVAFAVSNRNRDIELGYYRRGVEMNS